MSLHAPRSILHSLLIVLLLALLGCGTDEYERRLAGRAARLQAQHAAKFNELGDPQDVAGANIAVRLPKSMTVLTEGKDSSRRIKPGAIPLPGLKLTCEGFVQDSEGGQLPYYCYVGAVDAPLKELTTQIQGALAGMVSGPLQWTDLQAETPAGPKIAWRKMRIAFDQEFYYRTKDGQDQYPTVPGTLELYLQDAGPRTAIVAWRMPAGIEQNVGLDRLAPLVAGCVDVK